MGKTWISPTDDSSYTKIVIKPSYDTPTHKIYRHAPQAAHERDRFTNKIV